MHTDISVFMEEYMKKYINVLIKSKKDANKFDKICRKFHIQNLYDTKNTIFPHYRIICMGSDIDVPTAVWEVQSHWKQSIFMSGIDVNGGDLYSVDELMVAYKHIHSHYLDLTHKIEEE